MHLNLGAAGLNLRSLQRVHTRHQRQFAGMVHGLEDGRNLISTFVFTPDGLHHPEPLAALQIQSRLRSTHAGSNSPSNTKGNGLPSA